MARLLILALALVALIAVVSAASGPTFCKCTCFKNSTIIPLGPASQFKDSSPKSPSLTLRFASPISLDRDRPSLERRSVSTSCSECTKAFCLSQGIDFCKEAKDENVNTLCFKRVSDKDKLIVWGFIIVTLGLLGWAAFKRLVEWRDGQVLHRQAVDYSRVTGQG
ncbi:putative MFS transporter [Ophiocordyceps camponoti-floridani]|uniref:Putative MFS transporter n=1 Tax=Ophiocordyceps camponoti-floridani TaxID=2030778 RepID=A0A8H4QDI4_9HYPO|nr:putative MFS transporter [Ophiocordyceps camponoti-floridani]